MKFSEFPYTRPDMTQFEKDFDKLLAEFGNAGSFAKQEGLIGGLNELRNQYESMSQIAFIRYSMDTREKFYAEEMNFFNDHEPLYDRAVRKYYKALLGSRFRKDFENSEYAHLLRLAEVSVKTFSDEIIEDLKMENQLKTEYSQLCSSAEIEFDGKKRTLYGMLPIMRSKSRETRKKAQEIYSEFFHMHAKKFDEIFDSLVTTRNSIACKLGYKNFVQLGYARLKRIDYNDSMISDLRARILNLLIPLLLKLREKQRNRLGLESLEYYDQTILFPSGNPKPKGELAMVVKNAQEVLENMSSETGKLFNFLAQNELFDLTDRSGKRNIGFCTYIAAYKSPFIFHNYTGMVRDVTGILHELGHALQLYSCRELSIPEYRHPTTETAEVHSMSMELLTWEWMNLFFDDNVEKFKYWKLFSMVVELTRFMERDEFEKLVYENPRLSPSERRKLWLSIEKKYEPYIKYENNEFKSTGGIWQESLHQYEYPFYFVDFALADLCALQLWQNSFENREHAIQKYIRLCKEGSKKSFLESLDDAGITSPFNRGCIESIIRRVEYEMDQIDESKF